MKTLRWIAVLALGGFRLFAADNVTAPADPITAAPAAALNKYFEQQVSSLEGQLDRDVKSKEDWLAKKDEYRRQLFEMIGLDPMPAKTDLKATKTGEFDYENLVIEKWHYQSMPGLYVTANVYRPKTIDKPLPTILYVCGHGGIVKDGIPYGSKAAHQSHPLWYARHGFVCMVIDTLELGEIPGEHHGVCRKDRWWWYARGYTPAGVEAWNSIRGLDFLETRPYVDKTRFGVTGMSGGGAYSWWLSSLDERIKAAVPTAGITDLRNQVVDGCVEHHCDCMFFVNTYRWDYDKVAALDAPRALCIANSDKDMYFPIDGVFRIYQHARRIYQFFDQENEIGMQLNEGPHMDTQPLNTGEFHWMTRFLEDQPRTALFDTSTKSEIDVENLRVFTEIPKDARNATIDETFVPLAPKPAIPQNAAAWNAQRDQWMKMLREKCFHGWPANNSTTVKVGPSQEKDGIRMSAYDMLVEDCFPIRILIVQRADLKPQDIDDVVLNVLDEDSWRRIAGTFAPHFPTLFAANVRFKGDETLYQLGLKDMSQSKSVMAYVCPRGIGPTRWDNDAEYDTAHPKQAAAAKTQRVERWRRFFLIGQMIESDQVWDIRCAMQAIRSIEDLKAKPLRLRSNGVQAGNSLYATLFEEKVASIELHALPHSQHDGPIYLNVLKYLDMPQAVAMAGEKTRVTIFDPDKSSWDYARTVSDKLGWTGAANAGVALMDPPKTDPAAK